MTPAIKISGEQLAGIIDPAFLESNGIDANTSLEVTIDAVGIHLIPVPSDHHARVIASGERMMAIHDEAFRKLAL